MHEKQWSRVDHFNHLRRSGATPVNLILQDMRIVRVAEFTGTSVDSMKQATRVSPGGLFFSL